MLDWQVANRAEVTPGQAAAAGATHPSATCPSTPNGTTEMIPAARDVDSCRWYMTSRRALARSPMTSCSERYWRARRWPARPQPDHAGRAGLGRQNRADRQPCRTGARQRGPTRRNRELGSQLAFDTGWPNAISAVDEVKKVYDERGIGPVTGSDAPRIGFDARAEAARAAAVDTTIAPTSPPLAELTTRVRFGVVWRRPDPSVRDRSLVARATLIPAAKGFDLCCIALLHALIPAAKSFRSLV